MSPSNWMKMIYPAAKGEEWSNCPIAVVEKVPKQTRHQGRQKAVAKCKRNDCKEELYLCHTKTKMTEGHNDNWIASAFLAQMKGFFLSNETNKECSINANNNMLDDKVMR
eukprot:scaffold393246_cov69-Attheya_sp.AAC.1